MRIRRLTHVLVLGAFVAVLLVAIPAAAFAQSIALLPFTGGQVYVADSPLTLTWTSEGVPAGASMTLSLRYPYEGGLAGSTLATGLPLNGSYTATLPIDTSLSYFYHLEATWPNGSGGWWAADSDSYMETWDSGTRPWWFTVVQAPTITQQPVDQTVLAGQQATFTVEATGAAPLSIQWQCRSTPEGEWGDLSGATSPTLVTAATTLAMKGFQYRAVVTNAVGEVLSDVVTLNVLRPVSISLPWISPATPKNKSFAMFYADVTPSDAIAGAAFTLHLQHQNRVKGKYVWGSESTEPMTADSVAGRVSSAWWYVTARGTWRAWVTCDATDDFGACSSEKLTFTVK